MADLPEDERRQMALEFARAISNGPSVQFISAENKGETWAPLETAVSSGRAFMVALRPSIVALDLDDEIHHQWAAKVRQELSPQFRVVETASGREGHGHLWIVAPPGWEQEHIKSEVAQIIPDSGFDWVRKGKTRPPYAPHRIAGYSRVVDPDPATALRWFREAVPRRLSPRWVDLMATTDPSQIKKSPHGRPSRGITLYSVAVAVVNARQTFDDYERLVGTSRGLAATKYQELSPANGDELLRRNWRDASKYVRNSPPRRSRDPVRASVAELRARLHEIPLEARTGPTDRAVLAVLLDIADACASLEFRASVRQLGSETGYAKMTIVRSTRRLRALGLLTCTESDVFGEPSQFSLAAAAEMYASGDNRVFPGGPEETVVPNNVLLEDLFTNGAGLGAGCRETWHALSDAWESTDVVARRANKSLRTARDHLRKLAEVGLAERRGHCVRRASADQDALARVANLLGVKGKRARVRAVNRSQQDQFRRDLAERRSPGLTRSRGLL